MIELCSASEADVQFVRQCYHVDLDQATSRSVIETSIHSQRDLVYIAFIDEQRCGFAHAVWSGGPYELIGIGVTSQARRQGVGVCLIEGMLLRLKDLGADALWLEVRADNQAAQQLYVKTGAVYTGRRTRYYADGTDAALMSYALGSES